MHETASQTPDEATLPDGIAVETAPSASEPRPRPGLWLVVMLAAGLVVRAALSMRPGHTADVVLFVSWMNALAEHGLGSFHEHVQANYPPFYILVLRGLGELCRAFGLAGQDGLAVTMLQRLPACLADMALAILLYREGARLFGARLGLAAAALYYLNPVSLYISAYWGQVDSIHSLFVVAAVIAINRARPGWAGLAVALALLQKLQSIVFIPLVVFDVYRRWRWVGLGKCLAGATLAALLVLTPFVVAGSAGKVLRNGYGVVGQYPKLSVKAFNVWAAVAELEVADTTVPIALIRAAAGTSDRVAADATWYLALTWRRIGSAAFVVAVAVILSVHARRWDAEARFLAAAALAAAMFVFLTEMHERYLYPIVAILPLWAVASAWRERFFVFASALLLLNLTHAQPVAQIAVDIGVGNVLVLLSLVALLAFPQRPAAVAFTEARPDAGPAERCPPDRIVRAFQALTVVAWVGSVVAAGVLVRVILSADSFVPEPGVVYLSDLTPRSQRQGYRSVTPDADVEGSPIYLGGMYYLKGVGTHADAIIDYEVPETCATFEADVGIQRGFGGNVRVSVEVGGKEVYRVDELTAAMGPQAVSVSVRGAARLRLRIQPNGTNKGDHVNWGGARFVP